MLHAKPFCAISRRILTQHCVPLHGRFRHSHPKISKAQSDELLGPKEPERFDMIELVDLKFMTNVVHRFIDARFSRCPRPIVGNLPAIQVLAVFNATVQPDRLQPDRQR
jgi:hypothetical protein